MPPCAYLYITLRVRWAWRYGYTYSGAQLYLVVRARAVRLPARESPIPVEYDAGWTLEVIWTQWLREMFLFQLVVEPRFTGRPECSLNSVIIEQPGVFIF